MTESCRKALAKIGPRGVVRRQAMLQAATELFMEKGFERTKLSDVLERSKGSRATLYEFFGGKEGLLKAMMEQSSIRLWKAIDPVEVEGQPVAEALYLIGLRFVQAVLHPDAISVSRVLASEGHRFPEIVKFFNDTGPVRMSGRLADYLTRTSQAGGLNIQDAQRATQIFFGMICGGFHYQQLISAETAIPMEEIEQHVRYAVRIFLDGTHPPTAKTATA
ncbi:MAG TPA: TetR/AcrR family transcriptional regulator [Patescibacteria group bacterium]|nr:TetR/AcrR family transcriptional regulator [Patescibacteria group bacterium]